MDPTGLLGDGDVVSKLLTLAPIVVILMGIGAVVSWRTERLLMSGIRIGQRLKKDEDVGREE